MAHRKHISWKTKCAAALLNLRCERDMSMYDDAKRMTEDQFLSLFQWDHNILHETEDPNRDMFWNLSPMFIAAHRKKTKTDAKIIAKSRRIRKKLEETVKGIDALISASKFAHLIEASGLTREPLLLRTLRSRGFDKTKTRGVNGKVRSRKPRRTAHD